VDPTNRNTALCSAFAEELSRSGVGRAIVSPGSRSTPLALALWREPDIEVTVVIDERSAGFMALGAAAASGQPVALVCTSGTAGANYHPAVAEADLSSVPLIVLTADRPPELRDNGSGQTIDQIRLYGDTVRWFAEAGSHEADDAGLLHFRTLACRAAALAKGDPRPGPVHLNFPFREPLAPSPVPGAVTARSRLALEGRGELPLLAVEPAATRLPAGSTLDRLAGRLAGTDRVLILAGRQADPALRDPVARLAAAGNWPVLAEPTSQLLCGPHDRSRVIPAYARLGASRTYGCSGFTDRPELAPEVVIRFGEMPTAKGLRLWLAGLQDCEQVLVDPLHGFNEPTGRAGLLLRTNAAATADALASRLEKHPDHAGPGSADGAPAAVSAGAAPSVTPGYLEAWRNAAGGLPGPDPAGPGPLYRALAEGMPDRGVLYVNSSMPIRDLESFTPSLPADLLFLANRGANGIDGLIASGLGAALATGRPTAIVTGDVGFLHDLGSLANWRKLENRPHVLVIDNGGGAIFGRLPQKETMARDEFEALMGTPPGLDIPAAAALFGLPCHRLGNPPELPALLSGPPGLVHARFA